MNPSDNSAYTTHDATSMLLPWYVNGSLDRERRDMVDQHLAVCLTCRSELNSQYRVARLVQSRDDFSVGADTGFSQMCKRIQPHSGHREKRKSWGGQWFRMGVSAAAIAASIFAALPLLHEFDEPVTQRGEFRTLSTASGHFDARENSLRLMFTAGLDDSIRQSILRSIDAVVIDSSSNGVLTLQLPQGELALALTRLRGQPEVRLAEPVFTGTQHERTGANP